ncbi:hypothetical protein GUJ93_ZPchr0586g11352 [Zizania palustris]|uniref:Uncharacterized protein n=1 Tax=Zizania palustris TaxID=103762 RepID=A0A8J5RKE7_ZIZPA|nr:hypothetical protein GUJ93_ZPchr0586g11352 [Zizania palustris]
MELFRSSKTVPRLSCKVSLSSKVVHIKSRRIVETIGSWQNRRQTESDFVDTIVTVIIHTVRLARINVNENIGVKLQSPAPNLLLYQFVAFVAVQFKVSAAAWRTTDSAPRSSPPATCSPPCRTDRPLPGRRYLRRIRLRRHGARARTSGVRPPAGGGGSETLEALFRSEAAAGRPVRVLVYDPHLPWARRVAHARGVPAAAFFSQPCAVDVIYGEAPGRTVVPEVGGGTVRRAEDADDVLVNSFQELEPKEADYLASTWSFKTIGPTVSEELHDKCKERGLIVSWCPQLDVLSHKATGL